MYIMQWIIWYETLPISIWSNLTYFFCVNRLIIWDGHFDLLIQWGQTYLVSNNYDGSNENTQYGFRVHHQFMKNDCICGTIKSEYFSRDGFMHNLYVLCTLRKKTSTFHVQVSRQVKVIQNFQVLKGHTLINISLRLLLLEYSPITNLIRDDGCSDTSTQLNVLMWKAEESSSLATQVHTKIH